MEELETFLKGKNILKITEIIENSSPTIPMKSEVLPILSTFLIQKAGHSPSPQTLAWLKAMIAQCPKLVKDISDNFPDCLENLNQRVPRVEKLHKIKGKLKLFCNVRAEAPDMSTATPEHLQEDSEVSSEVNYQEFSVTNI